VYQLELPDSLSDVHDIFHVSQLKKCLRVPEEQLPIGELNVNEDLTYSEYPIRILETSHRITRSMVINMYKVEWSHHSEDEPLGKEKMNSEQNFPSSSLKFLNLEDEILFKGGRFVTPQNHQLKIMHLEY
jgi:hypothetical protein